MRPLGSKGICSEIISIAERLVSDGDINGLADLCASEFNRIKDDADTLNSLAYTLLYNHKSQQALPLCRRAAEISPDNSIFIHNLSCALLGSGKLEESIEAYSSITSPLTGFDGEEARDFVEEYATLSKVYDDNELHHYFTTNMLAVHAEAAPGRRLRRVLELGCGTGLLGRKIPASATSLWGIDISPQMLEIARTVKTYDKLVLGDMVAAMKGIYEKFDTIMSSGVLCYISDLRPIFEQVALHLMPDGLFVFSVDPCIDQWDIRVSKTGEYCHSRRYLRQLALEVGFEERSITIGRHRGPPGFWCVFRAHP